VPAPAYKFRQFSPPKYPPLAQMARIQGEVELELTVSQDTGEVVSVAAKAGHPLLMLGAIEAAKRWRFEPRSVSSNSLTVKLEYSLRCPEPVKRSSQWPYSKPQVVMMNSKWKI
jgi:TonB family protein